jgi:lipopolysaccharide transport system ATP-binding protein
MWCRAGAIQGMSETVIHVEELGKRYRVGERERYFALRDVLARAFTAPFRREAKQRRDDFMWALRGVSLDVKQGEVVGLIGRNGAGKSTLLKILSRITRPTTGFAEIHGRVGSLLEVGTGFHPELTGRENIYLSGAILGMSKGEIDRKHDAIVAFAEVDRYLDTPLKHFSTGMQMRLAFAVAAHLEPEILLVDEVLAVGDLEFQEKCLGKMNEVAHGGRTILFVSHNLAAVNALCPRSVLIEGGKIVMDGPTSEVTAAYHIRSSGAADKGTDLTDRVRIGTGKAYFKTLVLRPLGAHGEQLPVAQTGCDLVIDLTIEARADLPPSNVGVTIYDGGGFRLVDVNMNQKGEFLRLQSGEQATVQFVVRELLLKPGTYIVGLWLGRNNIEHTDLIEYAATLEVAPDRQTQVHSVVYPGPYLCRFETSVSLGNGTAV